MNIYKEYEREEFKKACIKHIRGSFPRGTFRYINVLIRKRYLKLSIAVNEGKKVPEFIDTAMKKFARGVPSDTRLEIDFKDILDVFKDFDGIDAKRFIHDDENVYVMGENHTPDTEESIISKTIEENRSEILETIEAGIHLSENDNEIEYLILLEKLIKQNIREE